VGWEGGGGARVGQTKADLPFFAGDLMAGGAGGARGLGDAAAWMGGGGGAATRAAAVPAAAVLAATALSAAAMADLDLEDENL
jgi:hypothetical protein